MLSVFNLDPKQCCFAVMLTDVGDQTFCEQCMGLGCCFCWQVVGSSVPILADVKISYCGTGAPLYISYCGTRGQLYTFLFLIVIFQDCNPNIEQGLTACAT